MNTRSARALVDSVLSYLETRQKAAALSNQRTCALLLAQAWLIVHDRFYGRVRPVEQPPIPNCDTSNVEETRKKPWFREKYAKPIRRVVAEFEYTTEEPDTGIPQRWYGQRLECGHVVFNQFDSPGVKRRKHIRCTDCLREQQGHVILPPVAVLQ